ncbi:MAG: hypothetical protein KJ000_27455 [Pirellulaceae bacterium]|nr:hypothetical protein [Pirellulaceae bacterium]
MSLASPAPGKVQVAPTRLRHTAAKLIGREDDLKRLDDAWGNPHTNVVVVRAFGGMGKTSLVAAWMADSAAEDWRGAERVFDWTFYSQGTDEHRQASSDTFIQAALEFCGEAELAASPASPWDKGAKLAERVAARRTLLVLDGLEPLQYPPGPMEGRLRDPAMEALLKGLARQNAGLCVVTTREKVTDLQPHYGRTADDFELLRLTDAAGAALLHDCGARRAGPRELAPDDDELKTASRELRGHGLTLMLVGQYLRLVERSDIRRRDTLRLAEAEREYQLDATRPYGHAFKAMAAYERWLGGKEESGRTKEEGQRMLAALRLLGLFDRPASADCLAALRSEPPIAGLTEPLVGLSDREWRLVLGRLSDINLLTVQADGGVDAHPLLREYFAERMKDEGGRMNVGEEDPSFRVPSSSFREAHGRLYEFLCKTTPDKPQPTLEDLQPLYQAVAHGCQAGRQQEACEKVYWERISRGREAYVVKKLGAFGADLGAVACFFELPWSRVSPALTEGDQAWLLGQAAFRLRALGRLTEALEPMRTNLKMRVDREEWQHAPSSASNLSELELTLGELLGETSGAVHDAEQSVAFADLGKDEFWRLAARTALADALHQAGRSGEALALFREAEQMQAQWQPQYPLLYSLRGFRYCDLLLADAERAAWQCSHHAPRDDGGRTKDSPLVRDDLAGEGGARGRVHLAERDGYIAACDAVIERAMQTRRWAKQNSVSLLDIALQHLTLGRAGLYRAILDVGESLRDSQPVSESPDLVTAQRHLDAALTGVRRAGTQEFIVRGLLTHAWLRFLLGEVDGARAELDEAWEIAERGPMPLHIADIHLHRARLFRDQDALAAAQRLIARHAYHRRDPELADAQAASEANAMIKGDI